MITCIKSYNWSDVSGEYGPLFPVHVVFETPVVVFTKTVQVTGREPRCDLEVLVGEGEPGNRGVKAVEEQKECKAIRHVGAGDLDINLQDGDTDLT